MRITSWSSAAIVLLGALGLAACTATPTVETLQPIPFHDLPGWADGDQQAGFARFRAVCAGLAAFPADTALGGAGLLAATAGHAADLRPACLAARNTAVPDAAGARRFFATWFTPYRADTLTLGGYYEPAFRGSSVPTSTYFAPVLARPDDLVTVRAPDGHGTVSGRAAGGVVAPYATRSAIYRGALDGHVRVLAWLSSPIDLYLLQKEGAGRIELTDGTVLRLGYAGGNGRKPASIGPALADAGLLPPNAIRSPAAIRAALRAHPAAAAPLLEADPSYVFFRPVGDVPPELGPPGTLGVPLAPGRSLAVDRAALPLGLPVWLDAGSFRALAFADDEGSDVNGAGHADLFLGTGDVAGARAQALDTPAETFVLLPRPPAA